MKRLYHMLALLALVNLFAIGGLVGYLFASGRLDGGRVEQIAAVLRGEWPETEVATTQPAAPLPPPEASRTEIARIQAQKEFYQLVAERHKREVEDRRNLNEAIRLSVVRDLEALDAEKERFKKEKEAFLAETVEAGFEKELELFSKMSPDLARDLLQSSTRKDADVVRLLTNMDINRAKKIVDSCKKKEADKAWIARIVEQIPKLEVD
jgi:hypothetical protein